MRSKNIHIALKPSLSVFCMLLGPASCALVELREANLRIKLRG